MLPTDGAARVVVVTALLGWPGPLPSASSPALGVADAATTTSFASDEIPMAASVEQRANERRSLRIAALPHDTPAKQTRSQDRKKVLRFLHASSALRHRTVPREKQEETSTGLSEYHHGLDYGQRKRCQFVATASDAKVGYYTVRVTVGERTNERNEVESAPLSCTSRPCTRCSSPRRPSDSGPAWPLGG